MKDEEFKDFDKKPEISYTVTGQQPFETADYWTEEVNTNVQAWYQSKNK